MAFLFLFLALVQDPPADVESGLRYYEIYVRALNRFGSTVPAEWRTGGAELRSLPAWMWQDERDLVAIVTYDAPARAELYRRGRIHTLARTFTEAFDQRRWSAAWDELRGLGDDAVEFLADKLLRQLMTATRRDVWEHVRYYLVECGEPAREQTRAAVIELSKEIAARTSRTGAVVSNDNFVQCVMVLIGFGDASRDVVAATAGHASAPVRAAAAEAIGESRDPTYTDALTRLLVDDDWMVRAAAAGGLGLHRYQRELVSTVLTGRLPAEPNVTVKQKMLESLGQLREPMSIGPMVGELNEAERRWNRIMQKIERIRREHDMATLETEVRRIQKERPKDYEEMRRRIKEGKPTKMSAADRDILRRYAEKEALVQPHVDEAIGQKDHMQKLMYALWKVTDQRLNTPAEWRDWWAKQK